MRDIEIIVKDLPVKEGGIKTIGVKWHYDGQWYGSYTEITQLTSGADIVRIIKTLLLKTQKLICESNGQLTGMRDITFSLASSPCTTESDKYVLEMECYLQSGKLYRSSVTLLAPEPIAEKIISNINGNIKEAEFYNDAVDVAERGFERGEDGDGKGEDGGET